MRVPGRARAVRTSSLERIESKPRMNDSPEGSCVDLWASDCASSARPDATRDSRGSLSLLGGLQICVQPRGRSEMKTNYEEKRKRTRQPWRKARAASEIDWKRRPEFREWVAARCGGGGDWKLEPRTEKEEEEDDDDDHGEDSGGSSSFTQG